MSLDIRYCVWKLDTSSFDILGLDILSLYCFSMVKSRVTLSLNGCTSVNIVFMHMDAYVFAGIAVALVSVILIMGGVLVVLFINVSR